MADVVVVCGHPRAGSGTMRLAREVGERLARGGSPVVVDIADFGPALLVPGDEGIGRALGTVQDARLLVVATPARQGSYAGALKVFLEQLPANALAGVVAVPVVTAAFQSEADGAEAFLARLLRELGADVVDFGLTAVDDELADLPALADQYATAITSAPAAVV